MSVGMDMIWNAPASSGCASVSTLAKTMPGCLPDASSKIGPKRRHGPHHSAQKSTSTMPLPATTSAKLSLVSSMVAMESAPITGVRCADEGDGAAGYAPRPVGHQNDTSGLGIPQDAAGCA